ncbi:MAG TPA: YlxR family protein [Actinomycetes bacterium]
MTSQGGPTRTCVGCRERAPAATLLRVVARDGAVVADPRRVLPGRGAHVHPRAACIDLAERRRAFSRALRAPGPLDLSALRAAVAAAGKRPGPATR